MANLFLKIDDIKGESQDASHKDEIELYSFSWGEKQPSTEGLQGQGKSAGVVHKDVVTFVTTLSKASPDLMLACATGKPFKKVLLASTKAGDKKNDTAYLTMEFSDAMISSYDISGSDGDTTLETIGMTFSKLSMEYKEQDAAGKPKGAIKKTYNFKLKQAE